MRCARRLASLRKGPDSVHLVGKSEGKRATDCTKVAKENALCARRAMLLGEERKPRDDANSRATIGTSPSSLSTTKVDRCMLPVSRKRGPAIMANESALTRVLRHGAESSCVGRAPRAGRLCSGAARDKG